MISGDADNHSAKVDVVLTDIGPMNSKASDTFKAAYCLLLLIPIVLATLGLQNRSLTSSSHMHKSKTLQHFVHGIDLAR